MTIVWFILWVVFAVAVLGFLVWSLNVLVAQRKAWGAFAAKYKLKVIRDGTTDPIALSGEIQGRKVNIYAQIEQTEQEHMQRTYSHIEVFLDDVPPAFISLSKKKLPEALSDMALQETFTALSSDWPVMAVSTTDDPYALSNWFTAERVKALRAFMDAGGRLDELMFIGDKTQAFLLWRTEDPLRDPRILNALVQKIFAFAKDMDEPRDKKEDKKNAPE